MSISDWSSDVCSSDLGNDDRKPIANIDIAIQCCFHVISGGDEAFGALRIILRQTPQRLVLLREPRISVFIRERTICVDFAPKRKIVEGRKSIRLLKGFAVLIGIISAENNPSINQNQPIT